MKGLGLTLLDLVFAHLYFIAVGLLFDAPMIGFGIHVLVIIVTGGWNNNLSDQIVIDLFVWGILALACGQWFVGLGLLIVASVFSAMILLNINRSEQHRVYAWHSGCNTRGPRDPYVGQ